MLSHLPPVMLTFLLDWPPVFLHCLILFAGLSVVEWPIWVALVACHFMLQIPGSAGPFEFPLGSLLYAEIGQKSKKYLSPIDQSLPH